MPARTIRPLCSTLTVSWTMSAAERRLDSIVWIMSFSEQPPTSTALASSCWHRGRLARDDRVDGQALGGEEALLLGDDLRREVQPSVVPA